MNPTAANAGVDGRVRDARPVPDAPVLFDVEPYRVQPAPVEPRDVPSADRRRTERQAYLLSVGSHPISHQRVHPEAAPADDREAPGRRCGNCRFRQLLRVGNSTFAKCLFPENIGADEFDQFGPPRVTHGAGTDVRKWWPACDDHDWGDPNLGSDAARWVPKAEGWA